MKVETKTIMLDPHPNDDTHVDPRDFLNAPISAPIDLGIDLQNSERTLNRELSWLEFDQRVLEEAGNQRVPLLERLRFLAISASNLDEFYTVRVAGLAALARKGSTMTSADGLSPQEQLAAIDNRARELMRLQWSVWENLRTALADENIFVITPTDLTERDCRFLDAYFLEQVFPILSPLAIDPAHPFPFVPSGGFALAMRLKRLSDGNIIETLLPVPSQTKRFILLPSTTGRMRFIALEDVLIHLIDRIFPGYIVDAGCGFRILRDSDLEVEDEAEDLVREFEIALKRRRRGGVVRLKMSAAAPKELRDLVIENLHVEPSQLIEQTGILGLGDLAEIVDADREDLKYPRYAPRMPERVLDHDGDIFAAVLQKDMLLHHPYETFDIVVKFLQQAARDKDVVAIKQTLYRTSKDSPIVEALVQAAESGKSVTAMIELKARFDEAHNIQMARILERAGAHVVYGFIDWKTHAKISTVVRREGNNLVTYSHFGTGNYHPITANFYTDLSLLTCEPILGRDATKVFNYVSGYAEPHLEKLSIAPEGLKQTLIENLQIEADNARAGLPSGVWAKMNSLVESEVIEALYEASQAGVPINLVVRGICSLRPGVKGLSDTIRVKSIVGRFLEHSRVACFANGAMLPSLDAKVYISSADWMSRNLNRRIETLVPIFNDTVKTQILEQVMAANLADIAQSWVMSAHGRFHRDDCPPDAFNLHHFFMENPSLSGRGSAGMRDVVRLTPIASSEMLRT